MSGRSDIKANIVTVLTAVSGLGTVEADRILPIDEDEPNVTFPMCLVYLGQGVNSPDEASLGYDFWHLPVVVYAITFDSNPEAVEELIYEAIHADSTRGGNAILTQSLDGVEIDLDYDLPTDAQSVTLGFEVLYEVAHGQK